MDGDDVVLAIDDADGFEVGEHGQGALRAVVWHRVVVEVEASVRCLADFDFHTLVCRKGLSWEREQAAPLVVEGIKRRLESSPIALGSDRRFLDTELTV
jgi:hypothetical protein